MIPKRNCDVYRIFCKRQDSPVGIVTGYGLGGWGSVRGRGKNFLFSTASRLALGPTVGTRGSFPGCKSVGV
jgi:hypothetical protein